MVNLKKVGEPESVIKFIGDSLVKYPTLATNATLFEKRATSKMDLAKICINTGRDIKSNPKTKARAWEMCRQLLGEAENDLSTALELVDNPNEKFFIESHISLLEKLKKTAQKPR